MRVGINASFLRKPATGIGQVTRHFLEELSKSVDNGSMSETQDVEYILYLEEALPSDIYLSGKFSVRTLLPLWWRRDDLIRKILWETKTLPKQARKDKCDVLLSLYQSATVVPSGMRHVMVVHDIIPRLFPEYLNNARKRKYQTLIEEAIGKADKIVAVSTKTEKDLIAHLDMDPHTIVVQHIDVDPIFKSPITANMSCDVMRKYDLIAGYIYSGGGLEKRKNVEGLLHAYARLLKRNKAESFMGALPRLVISGKLMPELAPLIVDVEKLVKELNLSTHVKILGFVPQEDLPALYAHAAFFVFPSLYEGFGLPVLEAMNQGTPVLTSRTTSLPEVGQDAVMYCDPADIEDMAGAMQQMLLNKKLRATLGIRGKERALDFSWSMFVQKVLRIL